MLCTIVIHFIVISDWRRWVAVRALHYRRAVLHYIKLCLKVLHNRVGAHIGINLVLPSKLLQNHSLMVFKFSRMVVSYLWLICFGKRVVNNISTDSSWGLEVIFCLGACCSVISLWWMLVATRVGAIWLNWKGDAVVDHCWIITVWRLDKVEASLSAICLSTLVIVPKVGKLASSLILLRYSIPLQISLMSLYLLLSSRFSLWFILISQQLGVFIATWSFRSCLVTVRWRSTSHNILSRYYLMIKMIKKPLTLVLYLIHHIVLDGRLLCINYRVIQFCLITSLAFELSEPNSDFSSYESESFSDLSIYPLPHISSNLI